jgi:prolyl-tRNA synthetase
MFQTQQECEEYTLKIHKLYNDFLKYVCCLDVLEGKKTESEKFAGAVDTYTREVLAQDGQCIQTGTSHYLGQNFAKMYDIKYQTNNNEFAVPYYMSAGLTTRLIGDLIVVHGDDKGLVLPSLLAPVQVAIISLFTKKEPLVETLCKQIYDSLNTSFRVEFDNSDEQFGYKITNHELRGVPITIAIGPNDAKNNKATMIRRDLGTKQLIDLDNIVDFIKQQLQEYNVNIYNKSKIFLQSSIVEVDNIDDFIKGINNRKVIKAC